MKRFVALLATLLATSLAVVAVPATSQAAPINMPACPGVLVQYGCTQYGWGTSYSYINFANAAYDLGMFMWPAAGSSVGYVNQRFRNWTKAYWNYDPGQFAVTIFSKTSTFQHGNNRVHTELYITTPSGQYGSPWAFNAATHQSGGVGCHVVADMSGTDNGGSWSGGSINLVEHGLQIIGCFYFNNFGDSWYVGGTGTPPM